MIGSALPPSFDMIGEVRRRAESSDSLSVHANEVGVTERRTTVAKTVHLSPPPVPGVAFDQVTEFSLAA